MSHAFPIPALSEIDRQHTRWSTWRGLRRLSLFLFLLQCLLLSTEAVSQAQDLALSRAARPWEFFSATGMRAGLFGNESGSMEAWVYPLKIFRNFHVRFLFDGHSVAAESLVRSVTVHPQSSTILYAGDTFSVEETLFVPVGEPGAITNRRVEVAVYGCVLM